MSVLPITIGPEGLQPTSPAALRAALVALVSASNPGYTDDLPGSLIEDITSTDVGALVTIDQLLVEYVNSISPSSANAFVLLQLGQMLGIAPGQTTNGSVFVVFSTSPPVAGQVIPAGFTVGDGTNQYVVQDGGATASDGSTVPLFCVTTTVGIFAVPANTVTTLVSSAPADVGLTCTNPLPGTPSAGPESEETYRGRVMTANLASSTGMGRLLRTALGNVPGVQPRLIGIRQVLPPQPSPTWQIMVGGGDPYLVGYAIWSALFDIGNLVGSLISIVSATQASSAVITTDLNHGLTTGETATIADATGMTAINGAFVVTVTSPTTFTIPVDTTSQPAYTGGGELLTNDRNVTVAIVDTPDTYQVTYVNPPAQRVQLQLTWNTISPFVVNPVSVQNLGGPALVAYVNSIIAGNAFNSLAANAIFQQAITGVVPTELLDRLVWTVTIDGVDTSPVSGTGLYLGDPLSFLNCVLSDVTITQG